MITQESRTKELKILLRRREEIRHGLREHFALPIVKRDYKGFESLVDELDILRKRIQNFKDKN